MLERSPQHEWPSKRRGPVDLRHSWLALAYGAPIGLLGGLIGLGGAEFRLPVLVGPLRYSAHRAIPLNLAVSLVTLGAALPVRARTLALEPLAAALPIVVALIVGALIGAFVGPAVTGRLSAPRLERVLLILLVAIGGALILEGLLPQEPVGLVPDAPGWRLLAGAVFGLGIGLVSSLLGVAGGELIIPTLVFGFGLDIKSAGTASLIISLPTVAMGLTRYARRGAFSERRSISETVAPMGLGSVLGAAAGGALVGIVPTATLKIILGLILMASAFRIFRGRREA